MIKKLVRIGVAAAILAGAHAQTISFDAQLASLPLSTPVSITTNSTSFNPTLVSASTLSRGLGLTAVSGAGRFNANSFDASSLGNAIAANDFYQFDVTPQMLITLDYLQIAFTLESSGNGATNYGIFSSIGGFTIGNVIQQGTISGTQSVTVNNATLGSAFNAVSTPTTFRIYAWGASSVSGTTSVNALAVTAVPEPSTSALIALGLAFTICHTQRRRRQA